MLNTAFLSCSFHQSAKSKQISGKKLDVLLNYKMTCFGG